MWVEAALAYRAGSCVEFELGDEGNASNRTVVPIAEYSENHVKPWPIEVEGLERFLNCLAGLHGRALIDQLPQLADCVGSLTQKLGGN